MATCTALPPVRRLSFVLGYISLWGGFGLCLKILFAPCGCRHAYCGPHCSRKSARFLASLFGSSPSGVRHLSVGALGVSGGSTYVSLHRTWSVSAILPYAHWSLGQCLLLILRDVQQVFMAIILSVSLAYACPSLNIPIGLCSLDT